MVPAPRCLCDLLQLAVVCLEKLPQLDVLTHQASIREPSQRFEVGRSDERGLYAARSAAARRRDRRPRHRGRCCASPRSVLLCCTAINDSRSDAGRGKLLPMLRILAMLVVVAACGGDGHGNGSCAYMGQAHDIGAVFPAGDGCNSCTCALVDGMPDVSCTELVCADGGVDANPASCAPS